MMQPLLEPGTTEQVLRRLFPDETPWEPVGRPQLEPHQVPPDGFGTPEFGMTFWLLEAGRGAGKTEACSRYYTAFMRRTPRARGRIIAPTYDDAVESCVRGPSGLLSVDPEVRFVVQPGGSKVIWPNGAEALVLGTPFPRDVDRLRAGGNRHLDWWEEIAANPQLKDAWDQAALGLRLGEFPHAIGSTTPRSVEAYRSIRNMDDTVLTKASLFDNPHNPQVFIDKMRARYEGTRLGRQEIYGELLEDVVGALWSRRMIEAARVDSHRDLVYIIVAVDPAATSKPDADDTGIVVAGLGTDGHVYVLEDRTCHLDPDGWGHTAVRAYHRHNADLIVGEVNNGGEMVEHVISTVDANVPFEPVHASRGKQIRAQPVASLYGNPPKRESRVHHVGGFPELEDELCTWVPGEEDSPDRLDALVWAVTKLLLEAEERDEVYEYYDPVKIGVRL